jgi:hypothetical protein
VGSSGGENRSLTLCERRRQICLVFLRAPKSRRPGSNVKGGRANDSRGTRRLSRRSELGHLAVVAAPERLKMGS